MSLQHGDRRRPNKKAIVLAHFGTTVTSALKSLDVAKRAIQDVFPNIPIEISFTSNIIRGIWSKRREEKEKWLATGVPEEVLNARSVLGVIGDLQDRGYRTLIIQPTYIAHGEQFEDLSSYIKGLQSIRTIKKRWMPFEKIVCSRPTLGTHGIEFDYRRDIEETVAALKEDIELARKNEADLIYVGHGNEYFSTGVYLEAQSEFRKQYPDVKTFVGVAKGYPVLDDLLPAILKESGKKIILKPFMLTAGDHAHHDIAGDHEESWMSRLIREGFRVKVVMEGLGSNHSFSRLYAKRIRETAEYHEIDLSRQED